MPSASVGRGRGDRTRRREARASSGCVAHRIDVGRQALAHRWPLMTAASFASLGSVGLSLSGAEMATRRLRSGIQSFGQRVDLGQRDLRQEALVQAVLVDDAGDRFVLDEVAHELVGERTGRALVLLDDRPLEAALEIQLHSIQLRSR